MFIKKDHSYNKQVVFLSFDYKLLETKNFSEFFPSLPLAKNFFKDQAKKLRNLLDFFLEICYNIFVGILVLIRRGVAKCLLSVIKIME